MWTWWISTSPNGNYLTRALGQWLTVLNVYTNYWDVTGALRNLKLVKSSEQFLQLLIQAYFKVNIKGPCYWPFVKWIHWWSVDSLYKGPVTQVMFPFYDVILKFFYLPNFQNAFFQSDYAEYRRKLCSNWLSWLVVWYAQCSQNKYTRNDDITIAQKKNNRGRHTLFNFYHHIDNIFWRWNFVYNCKKYLLSPPKLRCLGVASLTFRELSKIFSQNLSTRYHRSFTSENFKLKLCMCARNHALGTCTKFQLEILNIYVISGIAYFREIILKNSWNVSETPPWHSLNSTYQTFLTACIRCTDHLCVA